MSLSRSRSARTLIDPLTAGPFDTLPSLLARFASFGERSALVAFRHGRIETLSYAQLGERIAASARGLIASGVERGDLVVLLGPNSPEWVVACFAIVAAGAVAVPLDAQGTSDSAAAAIARVSAKAIITTSARREQLAPLLGRATTFWLLDGSGDDGVGALRTARAAVELPNIRSSDIASLLFTSGTTGTPKGVALTHANFAANVSELASARLIRADDRLVLPLPLHHTYPFTVGLITPLATGATVVLPAGISGPEILAACAEGRATALLAVPRLCAALWDGLESAVRARGAMAERTFHALLAVSIALRRRAGVRIGRRLFRSVHARFGGTLGLIGCGGAQLPTELAWRLEGLGFCVLTGYGLTETSPVLTFNSPAQSRIGSEGRALPGVELRIAGSTSAVPGEILARGNSVFGGYWGDAEATAAAFTADGWFRTGDLGRLDDEGYLHVVGRSKELLVLADGKKFFPELVEKVYAQSPLLKEVAVFERDGRLAAVIVPDEQAMAAHGALREAATLREEIEGIAARLPPYQRIASYRIVRSSLPRTQLGKLRRHLLPGLFAGAEQRQGGPAPLTATDRALLATPRAAKVWHWLAERFPDHELSLDTSPQLELGVDSLAWVALTVDIEREFDVTLLAEDLARILTLRDLLSAIEHGAEREHDAPPSSAQTVDEPGPALRALGAALLAAVRVLVRLTFRLNVAGTEQLPAGPALIAPNHSSYLDPLVVAAALPWKRLRRTYWAGWVGIMHKTALRRLLSRAVQVIPVDPDRDLAAAVRMARTLMEQGHDVVWFPEGRRSLDGKLQEFQQGVGFVLQGTAASAVPTAISGTFAAWPRHKRWPQPGRVGVVFGTPLEAREHDPAVTRSLLERAVRDLSSRAPPITPNTEGGTDVES